MELWNKRHNPVSHRPVDDTPPISHFIWHFSPINIINLAWFLWLKWLLNIVLLHLSHAFIFCLQWLALRSSFPHLKQWLHDLAISFALQDWHPYWILNWPNLPLESLETESLLLRTSVLSSATSARISLIRLVTADNSDFPWLLALSLCPLMYHHSYQPLLL